MIGGMIVGVVIDGFEADMTVRMHRNGGRRDVTVRLSTLKFDGSGAEIRRGDSLWWKGTIAMWTPRTAHCIGRSNRHKVWDIRLIRLRPGESSRKPAMAP